MLRRVFAGLIILSILLNADTGQAVNHPQKIEPRLKPVAVRVTSGGAPVPGAELSMSQDGKPAIIQCDRVGRAAANLLPGEWRFEVNAPGYIPVEGSVLVDEHTGADLDIDLPPLPASLRIRVRSRGGRPLRGAAVELNNSAMVEVGDDGEAMFDQLEPGTWNGLVRAGKYPEQPFSVRLRAGEDTAVTVVMRPATNKPGWRPFARSDTVIIALPFLGDQNEEKISGAVSLVLTIDGSLQKFSGTVSGNLTTEIMVSETRRDKRYYIFEGSLAGDYLGSADDGVLSGYGMIVRRGRSGEQAISCVLRGVLRGDRISGELEVDGFAVPF